MSVHSWSRPGRSLPALVLAVLALAALPSVAPAASQDTYSGSDLWLHYVPVSEPELLAQYRASATSIVVENAERNPVYRHTQDLRMEPGSHEQLVDTSLEAARAELVRGLRGLLGPGGLGVL